MIKNKIYELLDKNTFDFFPQTGHWTSSCFDMPTEIKEDYFPCHTRDISWLSSMFQQKFKLYFLTDDFIQQYLEQSKVFSKERHDYEQRVVKWQIDFMFNNGENWIVDPKLGGDLYILGPKCDIAFRKELLIHYQQ